VSSAPAKSSPGNARDDVPHPAIAVRHCALFLILALAGFATDIFSKAYIFNHYFRPGIAPDQHWWIDGVLGIETTTNPGALFGVFPGYRWLFASLSIAAIVGIVAWLFVFGGARDRFLIFALGLISGGILGNLYDRLGFGFHATYPPEIRYNVRDWIYFRLKGVPWFDPWPNFNFADSLLVCGAILLVLHSFFSSAHSAAEAKIRQS
jgi:signal peptidase II